MPSRRTALAALVALGALGVSAPAQERGPLTLATTHTVEQSGLLRHLLPRFTARTGIEVRAVIQGTGQTLQTGMRGDADLLLTHDPAGEARLVAEGHAAARLQVMYNDFVLVGPRADPAGLRGLKDAASALGRIAALARPFASRGDDSGTHRAEMRLWAEAGLDPRRAGGPWYRETGQGQGQTLNMASALDAYALTDRGTWLAFGNRGDLEILVEGDPRLHNQYAVMPVSAARHPHVRTRLALALAEWLVSPEGQRAIAEYRVGGAPAFVPNAASPAPGNAS